jgi:hypothetical protein
MTGSAISVAPFSTTTYTVSTTDANGCTAAPVVTTVVVNQSAVVGLSVSNDSIFEGDTTILTAMGFGGNGNYSYKWLPGGSTSATILVSPSNTTTYMVVLNSGCSTDTAGIQIYVDTIFHGAHIASHVIGGCNNSLWVALGGGAKTNSYSYVWSTGKTNDTISNLCAGKYSVSIGNGKKLIKDSITIIDPAGIDELQNNIAFNIYPVPATNKLTVQLANGYQPSANGSIFVYDITGRELLNEKIKKNSNVTMIDVSKLECGTYILMVTDGNNRKQAKFTKE